MNWVFLVTKLDLYKDAQAEKMFSSLLEQIERKVLFLLLSKMPSHSGFEDEKQKEKMLQEWLDQNQYTRWNFTLSNCQMSKYNLNFELDEHIG